MPTASKSPLASILKRHRADILEQWLTAQKSAGTSRPDLISEKELKENSDRFLKLFTESVERDGQVPSGPDYADVRALLSDVSRSRAKLGFSPIETAMFVFSLKEPIFSRLRQELGNDAQAIADSTWTTSLLIDELGLYTTEVYQKSREEVIARQQQDLLELSTPVVELWEGILALPLIGTLDSARTQVVMENLLEQIVKTGASLAIIDITGVPTVDTLVAQHLLKTVAAARLMGADCIISGIRAQIAQTIVHLGVDLQDVLTKASLADALAIALNKRGLMVMKKPVAGA